MWNVAVSAGTGMAIAGIGATYYALTRKDNELEVANAALLDARALSGFSNHPDMADMDTYGMGAPHRTYSSIFGFGAGERPSPRPTMTRSQHFLKASLEALAQGNGRTDGLNVARDAAHSHQPRTEVMSKNSGMYTFSNHRLVTKSETEPVLSPGGRNQEFHLNNLQLGSRSETSGYLRRTPMKIFDVGNPPHSEDTLSQTESSRSVFDVETCSQYQLYSSEDIPQQSPGNSRNEASLVELAAAVIEPRSPGVSISENLQPVRLQEPATTSTSLPKYLLRNAKKSTQLGSPYLTRAEQINPNLRYSKDAKCVSTTEKFQRKLAAKRKEGRAVRRCDTTVLGGDAEVDVGSPRKMSRSHEPFEPAENELEKDSTVVLFPPQSPGARSSVREANLPTEEYMELEPMYEDSVEDYHQLLSQEVETANVGVGTGSSIMFDTDSQEDLHITVSVSAMHLDSEEFPMDIDITPSEVYHGGVIAGIPSDSWLMLPLRMLPGDMVPWGLIFFTPLIIFVLGMVGFLIVSLCQILSGDYWEEEHLGKPLSE